VCECSIGPPAGGLEVLVGERFTRISGVEAKGHVIMGQCDCAQAASKA
jgi:hypothetical protein